MTREFTGLQSWLWKRKGQKKNVPRAHSFFMSFTPYQPEEHRFLRLPAAQESV